MGLWDKLVDLHEAKYGGTGSRNEHESDLKFLIGANSILGLSALGLVGAIAMSTCQEAPEATTEMAPTEIVDTAKVRQFAPVAPVDSAQCKCNCYCGCAEYEK